VIEQKPSPITHYLWFLSAMLALMKPRILISTNTERFDRNANRPYLTVGLEYGQAVLQTGGLPFFVGNVSPEYAPAYIEQADGLLLSGGVDVDPAMFGENPHPELGFVAESRDQLEFALYKAAKQKGIPVLGICRGIQSINVFEGGTLHQHVPAVSGTMQHSQHNLDGTLFHEIRLEPSSMLAKGYGKTSIRTDSYHHQAVNKVGPELKAVACTGRSFVLGVQWHPEMSFKRYPEQIAPFEVFMKAVKKSARVQEFSA
jgi:putative glutamine amidotransferase